MKLKHPKLEYQAQWVVLVLTEGEAMAAAGAKYWQLFTLCLYRCYKTPHQPHRPHRRQIQVLGIGKMCLVQCILLISIRVTLENNIKAIVMKIENIRCIIQPLCCNTK